MASYDLEFVAIGCNRISGCSDWGHNQIIAYAGGKFVVLYKPTEGRVFGTLPGHTGRVNALKWIPPAEVEYPKRVVSAESELISGGSEGDIRVWKFDGKETWTTEEVLKGHTSSVTGLGIVMTPAGVLWAVSSSSDNTVRIWKRSTVEEGKKWEAFQTLNCFAPWMVESIAISLLPGNQIPIIAAGSVDTKVHLFCLNTEGQFARVGQIQGHEDWIRSLSFLAQEDRLLMATACQDHRVRLWEIKEANVGPVEDASTILKKVAAASVRERDVTEMFEKHQQHHIVKVQVSAEKSINYGIMLETVLYAHEDWVAQVVWKPPTLGEDGKLVQPPCLLSISMDRTIIIWEPDVGPDGSGLWLDQVRVGEVGGNQLGFFGGGFGLDGNYIYSHGANSGFHLWKKSEASSTQWDPIVTTSGHFGDVMDIDWDPSMNYFVSTSSDQTTRLWSRWEAAADYFPATPKEKKPLWIEISRPQVHGYDLNCLTFVNGKNHKLLSGAEEKMLRVFDAPMSFLDTLSNLSQVATKEEGESRALSANVPPLGLSNKPVYQGTQEELAAQGPGDGENGSLYSKFDLDQLHHGHLPLILKVAPLEEQLMQRTLWAESNKLYGHPNELKSVTCNYKGSLIASGCKASVKAHEAAIRLWETTTWTSKCNIQFHKSTVTQIQFSHSDKYLLSVSKARTVAVMEIIEKDGEVGVSMVDSLLGHNRQVFCCSWSHDDKYFLTGSRDTRAPNAKAWCLGENKKIQNVTGMLFKHPVTAIAFAPISVQNGYVAAFGLEDGTIVLWHATEVENKLQWKEYLKIQPLHSHVGVIKKLRWNTKSENQKDFFLISCSKDFSVRLFKIRLE